MERTEFDSSRGFLAAGMLLTAAVLVWAAATRHNYGFYVAVRWLVCPAFVVAAIRAMDHRERTYAWVHGGIAALYNPFIRVHLTRDVWTLINLITAGVAFAYAWRLWSSRAARTPNGTEGTKRPLPPEDLTLARAPGDVAGTPDLFSKLPLGHLGKGMARCVRCGCARELFRAITGRQVCLKCTPAEHTPAEYIRRDLRRLSEKLDELKAEAFLPRATTPRDPPPEWEEQETPRGHLFRTHDAEYEVRESSKGNWTAFFILKEGEERLEPDAPSKAAAFEKCKVHYCLLPVIQHRWIGLESPNLGAAYVTDDWRFLAARDKDGLWSTYLILRGDLGRIGTGFQSAQAAIDSM